MNIEAQNRQKLGTMRTEEQCKPQRAKHEVELRSIDIDFTVFILYIKEYFSRVQKRLKSTKT